MVRTEIMCVIALLVTMSVVPFAGATGDEVWEAPQNPDFVQYMEALEQTGDMAVTALENPAQDATQPLGLVPTPIYRPTVKDVPMFASDGADADITDPEVSNILTSGSAGQSTFPPRYDLREQGRMTPVRDQDPWGTCWAFATFGSLESTLMSTTPAPDFSEKNLVNLAGFALPAPPQDYGGHSWMSTAYLTRWNGPVDEATDPYPLGPVNNWTSSGTYPPTKHVQNVVFFPARTNRTDTANLKGALVRWGAVSSSFCWYGDFYNKTHFSYYQPPTNLSIHSGHAVTIAGWDDTYEAKNFTVTPEGPGAWIVKNSWDATWGDAGYFYISYYDKHFGSAIRPDGTYKDTAAFLGESTSNYDRVYSYERLGEVNDISYNTNKTGGFANVFTINSSETLSAIGFYTTDINVPCTISIFKNPTSGPVGGSPVATFTKTLPYMGYNTVVIPPHLQVPLAAGNTFSVVVQVTNPTNDYYIPIEENQRNYTANITSGFGQDYLLGNTGWVDLKTFRDNSHVCLKAYTRSLTPPPPVANFTANVTSGTAPLVVQFTDTSPGSPTGWAWFFGDEQYNAPWTVRNASSGWSARDSFASVAMPDGSVLVLGGSDRSRFNNDVWRSTDTGVTWSQVNARAGWTARYGHNSVVVPGSNVLLMGGSDTSGNCQNDTWLSQDYGASWTQVNASSGWSPRQDFANVAMPDGSIILTGGGDLESTNDTWRSVDSGMTWTQVNASSGWSVRSLHSTVVLPDNSIVLMGGVINNADGLNDTWRSTDNGVTWTCMNASSGWSARFAFGSTAMPDGSIVIFGGSTGQKVLNDTWRSTDKGATWTLVNSGTNWAARYKVTSVAVRDGSVLLLGGSTGSVLKNDTWRFVPTGSSAQNPSHTYTVAGTYSVTMTAANASGSSTLAKTGYIVVNKTTELPRLILPDVSHYQNTVTSTPIRVMNLPGGTGISFNLTYDPSVIRVNEITVNESYASGSSLEVNATPGLIRLAFTRTEGITVGAPVPLLFLNTTGTGPVGASTPLVFGHAMWSNTSFGSQPLETVNGSILIYRIRGDLNGNGWVDIGDTAKTAYMVVKLTPDLVPDADFNNNGVIDVGDATMIACYLVGKLPGL
ncbi:MAG: lectin like domain-containing protein [Methanoregula sp.]|jgi:C1A family cysteine protease